MPHRKSSVKGENLTSRRQQEILEAAVKVFSRKGFSGSTTREIAAEAGMAEGTIFRYFRTKKDILLSLVGPYVVQSLEDTIEEMAGESDENKLTAIVRNRLNLIRENIDVVRLLLTEAQFHPELREKLAETVVLKASNVLEGFIAHRIQSGAFREVDPRIASRAFAGMVGIFVFWKEFLKADRYLSFNDDEVINTVVDIFLNGIGRKRGEEAEHE